MLQEAGGGVGVTETKTAGAPGAEKGRGLSPGRVVRAGAGSRPWWGASVEGMPGAGREPAPALEAGAARGPSGVGSGRCRGAQVRRGRGSGPAVTCLLPAGAAGRGAAGPGRAGRRARWPGRRRRQGPAAAAPQLAGRAVSQRDAGANGAQDAASARGQRRFIRSEQPPRAASADAAPPEP